MSNFLNKYKNVEGIELSYTGNDSHQVLVREVVGEAIKILNMYDRNCKISQGMAMNNCKKFLRVNFSLDEKTGGMLDTSGTSVEPTEKTLVQKFNANESYRTDEWRIEQYNRNRAPIDHIDSVEDIDE